MQVAAVAVAVTCDGFGVSGLRRQAAGRSGPASRMRQSGAARVAPLYSEAQIAARVEELARAVADGCGPDFLMVVVLKGAFVFAADLMRALSRLDCHPEVAFVTLSSYGDATVSSGTVRVVGELMAEVAGRRVLVVDDILDTRRTLKYARDLLIERGAAEVRLCVLLDKPVRGEVPLTPDYVGFTIGNHFVVGYGIDYAERYRDLPYIGIVEGGDIDPGPGDAGE